jgi:hypothetical protein
MKYIFFTIVSCFILNISFAQYDEFKTKYAIKGGYNYTTGKAIYSDIKQKVTGKHGFNIGAMAKIPFEGVLHFSPYIGYSLKGFSVTPFTGNIKKEDFTLHYFEIAPVLSVDVPMVENKFVLSAGPILGITSMGRAKTTDNSNTTTSKKMEFGYGNYGWFDLGVSTGVGLHNSRFYFEGVYTLGLTSFNNNEELDFRNLRNRTLSVNFGYYLR